MWKYIDVCKNILIPSLKSQTNKNFIWGLLILDEDINFVKAELDFEFTPFKSIQIFKEYCVNNNIFIQTRHDIDDWMSKDYVETIQKIYIENIFKYDNFLIQSQPLKLIYETGDETHIGEYTNTRNSMHLTLCQKKINHHIYEKKHGQMYEIAPYVITLPEGFTKWVIHGDNISCKRGLV